MILPGGRRLGWTASVVLLVGVYVSGIGAVVFAPENDPVATFWPAAAFGVATLALAGPRRWPVLAAGVAMASAAANLTGGRDLDLSTAFGLGNAAEALVAALVLTAWGRRPPRLETQDDVARLVGAALLGAAVLACFAGVAVRVLDDGRIITTAPSTLTSHMAATLVLLPVLLVVRGAWYVRSTRVELLVQVALLTGVSLVVFAGDQTVSLTFVPILFLAWAAVRFDLRVVAGELAAFGVATTVLTSRGHGPFGEPLASGSISALAAGAFTQGYLACAALITLPLGVAVQQAFGLLGRVSADEQRFRRNFTESLVGMMFLDHDEQGRLVVQDLNDTALAIFAGDRAGLVGRPLDDLLDVEPELARAVFAMLSGEIDGWQCEATLVGPRPGRVILALSLVSEGRATAMFSAQVLDVTAEYDARRRLEAAEQLTSATLDTTACIIMVTDPDGTVVRVNAATTALTGYSERELLGRPLWESPLAPYDARSIESLFLWPNRTGAPVVLERDAVARDGKLLRVVWNCNTVRDEHDRPAYAVLTGVDVTAERATTGLMNHLMQASFTTALVGIDPAGRISVFNSGAQHLLGYDRFEMVGRPFHELMAPEAFLARTGAATPEAAFTVLVRGLGESGETRARDWTWVTNTGTEKVVSMTLSVDQDAVAAERGYLCVARDVTEQRAGEEMLVVALDKERTAVERLRALDEAKNEFVSTVSHELRTPVTSIIGYTEMLQDGSVVDPSAGQRPLLETIHRNSQRLIALCDDLLMLSSLDSDNVGWRRETFDLATTLRPVEDSVRPLLQGRRLILSCQPPPGPVPVTGDRTQLERVMINLLSNAVKFTDDGGTIALRLRTTPDDAVLTVTDTGIGIPVEEQPALFQRFFRTSTAQDRAIQGTGLGLSIVAAIVSAHGGRIEVDSAHLCGTTFTVTLPLDHAA